MLQGAEAATQQQQTCKGLGLSLLAHSSPAAGRAMDRTALALSLLYFCFPGQGLSSGKQDKIPGPQTIFKTPGCLSASAATCKTFNVFKKTASEAAALPLLPEKCASAWSTRDRQAVHSLTPICLWVWMFAFCFPQYIS